MRLMWRSLNKTNKKMNKRNRLNNRLLTGKKNNRPMKKNMMMRNRTNKTKNKSLIPTNRTGIKPLTAKRQLKNKRSPPRPPNN